MSLDCYFYQLILRGKKKKKIRASKDLKLAIDSNLSRVVLEKMRSMVASDLCATEDTVLLLLDHLVAPFLPARSSVRDIPSQSEQQLVAKQVHAVVLLYNYYYRKQHRQLPFEGFESFSKLAVVLKPTLLAYMKLMQSSNDSNLDDLEKRLSVTEKTIMDACDISNSLDASKDDPRTKGWPISKVAVLLIDSTEENCYLKSGSMTQGVWSLIEKDVDVSSCISEGLAEGKHKRKKIKVTRKSLGDGVEEVSLQQVAFLAVKEVTGINQSDLIIIGSDVAYSLSKEKSMARFYMMQCKELKIDDVIQNPIPIKYAIDSLQGPLVVRSSGEWTVTPVVNHFHLLPYAGIMSGWLSRSHVEIDMIKYLGSNANTSTKSPKLTDKNGCPIEGLSGDKEVLSSSKDERSKLGEINVSNSNRREEPYEPVIHDNQDRSHVNSKICNGSSADTISKSPMLTDMNGCSINGLSGVCDGPSSVNVDTRVQVDDHQRMMTSTLKSGLNVTAGSDSKVEIASSTRMPCITECTDENAPNLKAIRDLNCSDEYEKPIDDCAMVTDQSYSKDTDRLQNSVAMKGKRSQTALRFLLCRRNKLTLHQHKLEDEIAVCDERIQTILNGGNDSGLNLESLEEDSNDICQGSLINERTCLKFENQSSSRSIEMKRLSEAILDEKNSCQELDDICNKNNWILPTYRVSPSDDEFQAHVTVKGIDFEHSNAGNPCSKPREARESAAAQMLAKLCSMASQTQ